MALSLFAGDRKNHHEEESPDFKLEKDELFDQDVADSDSDVFFHLTNITTIYVYIY